MRYIARSYQAYATQKIIDTKKLLVVMEMGLGKTVATLQALDYLCNDCLAVKKVLIVAPKLVADSVWGQEVDKWDNINLTYSKVLGTHEQRIKALEQPADLYITNRENIKWIVSHFGDNWPFDCIVIDESSSFKSHNTKRFYALRAILHKVERLIELTGTPAPNGLLDLWPQIFLLDEGARLGHNITTYRKRFFTPDKIINNYPVSYIPQPFAEDEIKALIADISFSMKAEDYIELPPRMFNNIYLELPEAAMRKYRTMARSYLVTLDDTPITAANAAVLMGKLMQLACGAVYDEQGEVVHLHDVKLDALEELLELGNNLLVFYAYQHDKSRLKARFPHAVELDSLSAIEAWNAGRVKMLIAHPASAGHGLNLPSGGHNVVWFSLPTGSLEYYQQANARLWRSGQTKPVTIHHLICSGTVDEDALNRLEHKDIKQEELIASIKANLERSI